MSKHTPGPWFWYSPQSSPAMNPLGAAFLIGPPSLYMDKSCGFSVGDAKLIAAAPELLEALENMLAVQYDGDPRRQISCDLCMAAMNAITKARGDA